MKNGSVVVLAALALVACGGGGLAKVSGTVNGLATGTAVTLQINGAQTVVIGAPGSFTFPDTLNAEQDYTVTVLSQPLRGYCTVANATGVVDRNGSDIRDIEVTCVPASVIGVTANGLPNGTSVTLQIASDITTESITLQSTGTQVISNFPTSLPAGETYVVSIVTQPTGHTCTLSANASGTVGAADVPVTLTCS